ncbi:MAG: hypothetical protein HQL94_08100 [Magnetococcales bacterium]|nr:hypothetical protein [Magnetococcales bacterium]MBF0437886.1 hypothetical protein [Magnetococcales bacterium]
MKRSSHITVCWITMATTLVALRPVMAFENSPTWSARENSLDPSRERTGPRTEEPLMPSSQRYWDPPPDFNVERAPMRNFDRQLTPPRSSRYWDERSDEPRTQGRDSRFDYDTPPNDYEEAIRYPAARPMGTYEPNQMERPIRGNRQPVENNWDDRVPTRPSRPSDDYRKPPSEWPSSGQSYRRDGIHWQ